MEGKFARFWGAVILEDEEPSESGPDLPGESDELMPDGDESDTSGDPGGG